jgi:hypothetical protein
MNQLQQIIEKEAEMKYGHNQPALNTFTPGVPTEDGWYVCKHELEYWELVLITDGLSNYPLGHILSHAKLPEL